MTDEEKAEIREIVGGIIADKQAEYEAKLKDTVSNLQTVHSKWGTEQGDLRKTVEEVKKEFEEKAKLLKETLDTEVKSVVENLSKKSDGALTTEESSADLKARLIREGKWAEVKKRVDSLPEDERKTLESDENVLVNFLKLCTGQPKSTSFFEDEPASAAVPAEELAKAIFERKPYIPKGTESFKPRGPDSRTQPKLRTVGRGLRQVS